jgi:membrane-associated phospholipid phosphatase
MIEQAKRHAVAGFLVCVVGFAVVLVCAYWVGPLERLDRTVLDLLSVPTDTLVNQVAYAGFQVVNFRPFWVLVGTVTALIALAQWRIGDAVIAVALVAGTGGLDLALKALLANPRYQPVPVDSDAYPWKDAFPSGHSAGSLAFSLAFLTVVPPSWRRPTAAAGIVFTLYISLGVLVLNYHYPSDVLGGWLLAAGWWFALLALPWFRTDAASAELTRSSPPFRPRRRGSRRRSWRRARPVGREAG